MADTQVSFELVTQGSANSSPVNNRESVNEKGQPGWNVKVYGEDEKAAFKEDLAAETLKNKLPVRIFMYCVWILSGALMLYFTSR